MKTHEKDPLRDCILHANSEGITVVQIATSAKVSSTTVGDVFHGRYLTRTQELLKAKKVDCRLLRGILSSMTRLALCFNLDPRATADAYKFPQTESINASIDHARKLFNREGGTSSIVSPKNQIPDQTISKEDLDLLSEVVGRIGGPILLSTALLILKSRRDACNGSNSQ